MRSTADEHGCALHDGDTDLDVLPVADGAAENESGDTPDDVGTDFVVLLLFDVLLQRGSLHLLRLLEEHETSSSTGEDERQETEVDDGATGNSEHNHIHKADKESSSQSNQQNILSCDNIVDVLHDSFVAKELRELTLEFFHGLLANVLKRCWRW